LPHTFCFASDFCGFASMRYKQTIIVFRFQAKLFLLLFLLFHFGTEKRRTLHCKKKRLAVSRPQPGCHLPNSPWPGMI
jgi:hypothetical protein